VATTVPGEGAAIAASPRSIWIRGVAGVVDLVLAVVLALLLQSTSGELLAGRAAILFRVGQPDTLWTGTVPLVLGAASHLVYGYPLAFLLVTLPEGWSGASAGKLLTRSVVADARGSVTSRGLRWRRLLWKASGAWIFLLALLTTWWPLAVLAVLAGVVVALGCLAALGPSRRTLHDRISGSTVVRAR